MLSAVATQTETENKKEYVPSLKEREFLAKVQNGKYDRQIIAGLKKFVEGTVPEDMRGFYSQEELRALSRLHGTSDDVEARMPVKITRHYFDLAKTSPALQRLVKASPRETENLEGSPDPGNQMCYSPVEGLIHKYELGLIYVVSTCSAHCRFCYREELIARKEIEREDGSWRPKELAQIAQIADYVQEHNRIVAEHGGKHPDTGREKLREILMSGGDPMVLGNRNLAQWLAALATAGIETIRIGTKELSFHPERFDDRFFAMLDAFHEAYPGTKLRFMIHFTHPDEFLKKDVDGNYIQLPEGGLEWVDVTKGAISELGKRNWLTIDNQAPIIRGINDDPDPLRILQRELRRNRVENHYFFCGRDIVGYRAFNVPIEEAWHILNESQRGLSGVEAHARLSIAHYYGKAEIVAVTDGPTANIPGGEQGLVIMKLLRSPEGAHKRGKIAILGRNPDAIWFDGYKDRVIYDEAGLFVANHN